MNYQSSLLDEYPNCGRRFSCRAVPGSLVGAVVVVVGIGDRKTLSPVEEERRDTEVTRGGDLDLEPRGLGFCSCLMRIQRHVGHSLDPSNR